MFRTLVLRYYYRYKIYAWITRKALEYKESKYQKSDVHIIGGVNILLIREAPPLKRSVSFLTKAKQPQLTRKAFELRSKDTSCPKHPFFGIVKILQIVKFHYLTTYLKKLKNTRFYLIKRNCSNFDFVCQSLLPKAKVIHLLLKEVRVFLPSVDKYGSQKVLIRIAYDGMYLQDTFTYTKIAKGKLWKKFFDLSKVGNLIFWKVYK